MSSWLVQSHEVLGVPGIRDSLIVANSDTLLFILPDSLHGLLAATAATQGLQEAFLLFTVFQEVLRRYTGQKSVAVNFDMDGVAPRIHVLEGNLSLRELVEQRQNSVCDVLSNVTVDGQFSFQCTHGFPGGTRQSEDTSAIRCSLNSCVEGLTGCIAFERKIWDPAVIKYFVSSYQTILSAALTDLDCPIGQLDLLNAADIKSFDTWNATRRYYPRARVDELFDLRASERPDDTAVTFLDSSMSYGSLSVATQQLATRLQSLGVQPGSLVGICMDRCAEMVTALLATFRTGAAYLPLDPASPLTALNSCSRMRVLWSSLHNPICVRNSPLLQRM